MPPSPVVRSCSGATIAPWVSCAASAAAACPSGWSGRATTASRHGLATRAAPAVARGPTGAQIAALLAIAEAGAEGWALIPSADETASLVARHHERLAQRFVLTTPPWETLRHACDKRLTYPLAQALGVDVPLTWYPEDRAAVEALDLEFPVILKPAWKEGFNRLTAAKAWRVDSREELLRAYDDACRSWRPPR